MEYLSKLKSENRETTTIELSVVDCPKNDKKAFFEILCNVADAPVLAIAAETRLSAKLSDGDVKGALRLLTSSDTAALPSDENIACLKLKHPDAPADLNLPPSPDQEVELPAQVSEADITAAIGGFNAGSSAGLDGLRPAHLKDLISKSAGEAGARLATALTALANVAISGELPAVARPAFFGATLTALRKSDGGLRPIAVGCVYRRLATKVALKSLSSDIGEQLRPAQLGYGTSGGCEAAVHSSRQFIENMSEEQVFVKIDMKNAFNTIRRDTFLQAVRERVPGLYRLLWQAYSRPTPLYFGTVRIQSATGLQQGDPCGPAVFSLGIDAAVREVQSAFNMWYLDDGSIGGSVDTICRDLHQLIPALSAKGLLVNPAKCEIFLSSASTEHQKLTIVERLHKLIPGAAVVGNSEARMLGAPLADTAAEQVMAEKKEDLERMVDRLQHIDAHSAFYLLRNCLWIPKLQYILRAAPVYRRPDLFRPLDETLRAATCSITNVSFSYDSWAQAVLPTRYGGLGLRRIEDLALPSYVASLHHCMQLVVTMLPGALHAGLFAEREMTLTDWKRAAESSELPAGDAARSQRAWDSVLADKQRSGLLSSANQRDQARLLAAGMAESGAWLHALPSTSLGTLLDPPTLRVAVALRVGANVCQPHRCRCGSPADSLGHHALTCRLSAGRHPRHTALNDVIRRALHTAGVPSILEPAGIDRGDGKRPDGMTIFPFTEGRKSLVWDATCVNTYAASHLPVTAVAAGAAARDAEELKKRKYSGLAGRFQVQPVAFETSGACGPATSRFVRQLGARLVGATGDAREQSWLHQRLALAVVRGNAASVLHTTSGMPEDEYRPSAPPNITSTTSQEQTNEAAQELAQEQGEGTEHLAAPSSPSAQSGSCERLGAAPDASTRENSGGFVVPIAASSSAPPVMRRCGPFGPLVMHAEKLAPREFEIPWGQLFGARAKFREPVVSLSSCRE